MPPKIAIVCGPTASGKTRLGVELALRLNGEVVSADSMQIYRGMDIGTAKPTQEEMRGVPHHMLGVADPRENYSVARYVEEASAVTDDILRRGKLPIVVGGTGLYLDALRRGTGFAAFRAESGLRETLREKARAAGSAALWEQLRQVDPAAAERLHPNDEKRIVRALEVWYGTGKTITEHNLETQARPDRYEAAVVGLNFRDRQDLRDRIDRRVDEMMALGLFDEVRSLLDAGVPADCTAMQAIGYKELVSALRGERPLDAAVEEIKLRSRQYAKRQLTWFRRDRTIHWILWEKEPEFSSAIQDSTAFFRVKEVG